MEKEFKKYDFSDIIENSDKKLVLVIYDIIDNRRRNEIVKLLEGYGIRVQKSAFEVLVYPGQYQKLLQRIYDIISGEDNVRTYRLNSSNDVTLMGNSDTVYDDEVIII